MTDKPVSAPKGRAVLKDMIPIRTYVLPEEIPTAIKFSKHMLRFSGLELFSAGPDLIWGVHGTSSLNAADAMASREAQHLKRRHYQVELHYRLAGLPDTGTSISEEFVNTAGYLHFSRITSPYRKKLGEMMMEWLWAAKDPQADELLKVDFDELVKQRPMLIHKLMAEQKSINAIIHPVLLNGGVSLRIATLRNIPANVARVYTRFYEEIPATV